MSVEKIDMLTSRLRRQSEQFLTALEQAPQDASALFRIDCSHFASEFGLSPGTSSFSAMISPSRACLAEALLNDRVCVEYFEKNLTLRNRLAETMLDGAGFYVLLSTASAMRLEVDRLLMDFLTQRLGLSREQCDRVETAFHEALLNALLYGNLELDASQRQTVNGFNDYCNEVEQRLSDPHFAARWIEIRASWSDERILIDIMCSGQGFDETKIGKARVPGQKHGWGISIMRKISDSMLYSEQGRRLSLGFNLC